MRSKNSQRTSLQNTHYVQALSVGVHLIASVTFGPVVTSGLSFLQMDFGSFKWQTLFSFLAGVMADHMVGHTVSLSISCSDSQR